MSFFNWFNRESVVSDTVKPAAKVTGGTYKQHAVTVRNKEMAMKIAAVYRAVYLISSGAAALTLQYKRKDRAKNYFKMELSPHGRRENYLLSVKPNERMNIFVFTRNLVAQVLLTGNAVVIPERDENGRTVRYILCGPNSVTYDNVSGVYDVYDTVNKLNGRYLPEEVIHVKNMCMDGGYWGMSTIAYAATTLGIASTADRETLKRFGTGGRFKAILQNDKGMKGFGEYDDGEMTSMAEDIQDSLDNGDDIIQVRGDGSLTPISMNSADMQFLESRKFTIREIARFFNVPPSKLMDDTNSNYKSTEMSNIQFYVDAVQPIVMEIEREWNAKMLSETTFMDYKYVFDLRNLYALDLEARAKWDKARMENGQASVNDLRRESDKEPVEGGDEVYLSVNFAPLGSEKLRGAANSVNGGAAGNGSGKSNGSEEDEEKEDEA